MIIGLVIPWWLIAVRVVAPLIKLAKWQRDNSEEDGVLKSVVEMNYSEPETYPAAPVTMAFFP